MLKLSYYRKKLGLSQIQLAKKLNMFEELYPIQNITEREIVEKFNIMKIKNIIQREISG